MSDTELLSDAMNVETQQMDISSEVQDSSKVELPGNTVPSDNCATESETVKPRIGKANFLLIILDHF